MKTIIFAFLSLLFAASICAQTKVSAVENVGYRNSYGYGETLQWQDKDYFLTSTGPILKLSGFDGDTSEVITIDLEVECANISAARFKIYGDQLFVSTAFSIMEIDLVEKDVVHVFHFDSEDGIREFSRDKQDGLLVTFNGSASLERLIARADLTSKEINYKTISPAREISIIGNYIVTLSYETSQVVGFDLRSESEVSLLESEDLKEVDSDPSGGKLYFHNGDGSLYQIDESLEVNLFCTNLDFENVRKAYVLGEFLYKYHRVSGGSVSSYYEIINLNDCSVVKNAEVENSALYAPVQYDSTTSLLQFYDHLLLFDYDTYEFIIVESPMPFVTPLLLRDSFAYAQHTTDEDSVLVFEYNLETRTYLVFDTGLRDSKYRRLRLVVHSDDLFSISSNREGKVITVFFNSNFMEVRREVLSDAENYGLTISNSRRWTLSYGTPLLDNNGTFLQMDEDSLALFSYPGGDPTVRVYQRDTLYGYTTSNDSVFFTMTVRGSVVLQRLVSNVNISSRLIKRGSKVWGVSLGTSQERELYPSYMEEVQEGAFTLKAVYHQFEDKVLAAIKVGESTKLALLGDGDFEVIWHGNNTSGLSGRFEFWNTDQKSVVFVFGTVQDGSLLVSIDQVTKEVLYIKEMHKLQLLNESDGHKQWKSMLFGDPNRVIKEVLVTDGLTLHQFTFKDIARVYGGSLHYSNRQLFFTNEEGSYVMDTDGNVAALETPVFDNNTSDVFYHDGKYYCLLAQEYEVKLIAVSSDFSSEEVIFEAKKSPCRIYSDSYFIENSEEDRALLVLNTLDYGRELWQMDLATQELSLLTDLYDGGRHGFTKVQFILDGQLYFTGIDSKVNTQLYRLDIGQQTSTAMEELESAAVGLYPNPTSGVVYMDSPLNQMILVSSTGAEVSLQVNDSAAGSYFNIDHLPSGIYFLTGVNDLGELVSTKLCKL